MSFINTMLRRRSAILSTTTEDSEDSNGSHHSSPLQTPVSSADTSPPSSTLALPTLHRKTSATTIAAGPVIEGYKNRSTVTQPVIHLEGFTPSGPNPNGYILIRNIRNQSPVTEWPVSQFRYKALAYLDSGKNTLVLDYHPAGSNHVYSSTYEFTYMPVTSCPPVRLVLLHAKDSPYAPVEEEDAEENRDLEDAKAKFRMSAYLWQSYMSDQVCKFGHERKAFQLENSWEQSTLFSQDQETFETRNQAPVHVVNLNKTLEELEQTGRDNLVRDVERAIKRHFRPLPRQRNYFVCMTLDTAWDSTSNDIKRGVVYGGPGKAMPDQISMAIYGGHLLHTYPSSIDQVTMTLTDQDPSGLPDDTRAKCASVGLGQHLQQIGYMLELPDQESGLMGGQASDFSNYFNVYCRPGMAPRLHPLDAVRLAYHPILKSATSLQTNSRINAGLTYWGTSGTSVTVSSRFGITAVEIYKPGDRVCHHFMNLALRNLGGPPPTRVDLNLEEIMSIITQPSADRRRRTKTTSAGKGPFIVHILTTDGKVSPIVNFEAFAARLKAEISGLKKPLLASQYFGRAESDGVSTPISAMFPPGDRLLGVTVHHTPGRTVHAAEFTFELGHKLMLGSPGHGVVDHWSLDFRNGESFFGMELTEANNGEGVCGVRFVPNTSRRSPWFGKSDGNVTAYMIIPPHTFQIAGIQGSIHNDEIRSLQFVINR